VAKIISSLPEEVLTQLKTKSKLSDNEAQEFEKSFFEIIDAKITKRLGEELNEDQQNIFVAGLKDIEKDKNPEKITQVLQQVGFDPEKAKVYIEQAVKQALEEIINILGDRLPAKDKEELLVLVTA